MRKLRTTIVMTALVLLVSAALPVTALGQAQVVDVTGTLTGGATLWEFEFLPTPQPCPGLYTLYTEGAGYLECSSPLLTGTIVETEDGVGGFDWYRGHGSFDIALDAGGHWVGRMRLFPPFMIEFVGHGYGGAIDGATLQMTSYGSGVHMQPDPVVAVVRLPN